MKTAKEFNNLRAENFEARLKQTNLATEADFVEKIDFDVKLKR